MLSLLINKLLTIYEYTYENNIIYTHNTCTYAISITTTSIDRNI